MNVHHASVLIHRRAPGYVFSPNAFRKFDEAVSRRENPRIARRFNAGSVVDPIRVPKGRLNAPAGALLQPSLRDLSRAVVAPALKRWAIFNCPFGTSVCEFPKGIMFSPNISQALGGTGNLPVPPGYQPGGSTTSSFSLRTTADSRKGWDSLSPIRAGSAPGPGALLDQSPIYFPDGDA